MRRNRCLIIMMWATLMTNYQAWWSHCSSNCGWAAAKMTAEMNVKSRIARSREAAMMQIEEEQLGEDEGMVIDYNINVGSEAGTKRVISANHKVAYGTILYMGTRRDYEFYVAARVLLQSLARRSVQADLFVIASLDVPKLWTRTMSSEGVKVVRVENIRSPLEDRAYFNGRFKYSLNKVWAWRLVEYERVVMMDADNLLLRDPSELFLCGSFCAVFIDPCIFHTGLFVLQPSNKVFDDIYRSLSSGEDNIDGADQGFLTSYFTDLLDKPLFHPPPANSTTRLDGQYRLPLGYQMDASYYYIRLKWRVPCGIHSVITFPSASWLKPWYWWSWPVLPLGHSWHNERLLTIGYTDEIRILLAQSFVYCAVLVLTLAAWLGLISFGSRDRDSLHRWCASNQFWLRHETECIMFVTSILPPLCIIFSFVLPMWMIPTTSHPLAGWGVFLLGAFSMLITFALVLELQIRTVVTPWLLICVSLFVMAFPSYTNGIVRMLSIFGYGALSTPLLWWSLKSVAISTKGKGASKRSSSD